MLKKSYTADEKAKIAMEAIKEHLTLSQIASQFGVHATQINKWKARAKQSIVEAFKDPKKSQTASQDAMMDELFKQIGQLKVELDWSKKKSAMFNSK
jgi:transposase